MSEGKKTDTKEAAFFVAIVSQSGNLRPPGRKSLAIHTTFDPSSSALTSGASKSLRTFMRKSISSVE
jgi:hypothetical protein